MVGTPGRIVDLMQRGVLDLLFLNTLVILSSYSIFSHADNFTQVLDEADHMLDRGFEDEMEEILKNAPTARQTLMFSATLPSFVKYVSRSIPSKY